jgi:hypothetical protein
MDLSAVRDWCEAEGGVEAYDELIERLKSVH